MTSKEIFRLWTSLLTIVEQEWIGTKEKLKIRRKKCKLTHLMEMREVEKGIERKKKKKNEKKKLKIGKKELERVT